MTTFEMTFDPGSVEAETARVERGLREHNIAATGDGDYLPLHLFVRDDQREVIGGLLAGIYWGWLSISTVWVSEEHRQQGHATRLMEMAEAEALERGCRSACLDTFSFQARPLYEGLGYRIVGTIVDLPAGHERYYMVKDLRSGELA